MHRVIIADIVDPSTTEQEATLRIQEVQQLVYTYGGMVVVQTTQKKQNPDYKTYVGSGKLDEILQTMQATQSDLLLLGNILKPRQMYEVNERLRKLSKETGYKMQCRDKVDLILKIFQQHAHTMEAKLQIELASIKHMGPRIFGMGMELSRQGGGIGTKGIGETNTELMKRHLRKKQQSIEKKLQKYEKMRNMQRRQRKKQQFKNIGIVGYTNAGKSSLMNKLTSKNVVAENKLFATLGTRTAKLFLGYDENYQPQEVLLHDTIGFMRNLPPQLIQAFRSTLEDSIYTDLLLHVVDSNDPEWEKKRAIVDDILTDIGATQPKIYLYNKIDLLTPTQQQVIEQKNSKSPFLFCSTHTGEGCDRIKEMISTEL